MRKIFNLYKLHKVHKTVKYFSAAYFTPKKKIKECSSIRCNVIYICKKEPVEAKDIPVSTLY